MAHAGIFCPKRIDPGIAVIERSFHFNLRLIFDGAWFYHVLSCAKSRPTSPGSFAELTGPPLDSFSHALPAGWPATPPPTSSKSKAAKPHRTAHAASRGSPGRRAARRWSCLGASRRCDSPVQRTSAALRAAGGRRGGELEIRKGVGQEA